VVIRLSDYQIKVLGRYGKLLLKDGFIKKNTPYSSANAIVRLFLDMYNTPTEPENKEASTNDVQK